MNGLQIATCITLIGATFIPTGNSVITTGNQYYFAQPAMHSEYTKEKDVFNNLNILANGEVISIMEKNTTSAHNAYAIKTNLNYEEHIPYLPIAPALELQGPTFVGKITTHIKYGGKLHLPPIV